MPSSSWEMDSPKFRHRQVRPEILPTICESSVFLREEDYHRTLFSSELLKMRRRTRKGYTKLTQRFEEDEGPEDEQPLLSSDKDSKPKRSGGWKMKKGVRILWSRSPRRSRLRSTVKVLSPFLLLRTMRDAYVRVLNTLGGKLNQKAWYSVGARAI